MSSPFHTPSHGSPDGSSQTVDDTVLVVFVFACAWLFLAVDLVQQTMGLDGVIYAGIAKFMAMGEGSFWRPPYFDGDVEFFSDHPPLGLWLQSLWFSLFGEAFWVERLFCVALSVVIGAMIVGLARDVTPTRKCGWWSLLIFFLMPVTTYTLKNNALDSMVAATALVAVWMAWHGRKKMWLNLLVGLACVLGFLIKGPVALFPLAAPACFAIIMDKDFRQLLITSAWTAVPVAIACLLLLPVDSAVIFLQRYFENQVLASLAGDRLIVHGRGYQLLQLLNNLAVATVATLVGWVLTRSIRFSREFWSFFVIGLLGALPLLLSPRQFKHYLLPSMPFFAIGAGTLIQFVLPLWRKAIAWMVICAVMTLGVVRAGWHFAELGSDADELQDAAIIAAALGPSRQVLFCENDLQIRTYLARHHGVVSKMVKGNTSADVDVSFLICATDRGLQAEKITELAPLANGLFLWRRVLVTGD
jgi:4-amino-4-deoxy-L-arabinose transferase-like glycosyltransferase